MAGKPPWTLVQEKQIRDALRKLDEEGKAIWIAFRSDLPFDEALRQARADRGGIVT